MEVLNEKKIIPEHIIPERIEESPVYISKSGIRFNNDVECIVDEIKYDYEKLKKMRPIPEFIGDITINDNIFVDIIYIENEKDISIISSYITKYFRERFVFNEKQSFYGKGYYVLVFDIETDYEGRNEECLYDLIPIKEYLEHLDKIYNWYIEKFSSII